MLLSDKEFVEQSLRISAKSLYFHVSPLLNPPLRMGGLAAGFVYESSIRGSSLKFIAFISSDSR